MNHVTPLTLFQKMFIPIASKNNNFLSFNCFPAHCMSISKNLQVSTNLLLELFDMSKHICSDQINDPDNGLDNRCQLVSG